MKDDGGPAFPSLEHLATDDDFIGTQDTGMSLRDYFAAHAPVTIDNAVNQCFSKKGGTTAITDDDVVAMLAKMRFAYADAMIAERAK